MAIKALVTKRDGTEEYVTMYYCTEFADVEFEGYNIVTKRGARRKYYIDKPITFDIETATIDKRPESPIGFMYIWQACILGKVFYGRTWNEFIQFCNALYEYFDLNNNILVCYVHNLSYEFQFMKDFFEWKQVFATDRRKVIYAVNNYNIEFRCSYKLTNKSLAKYTENQSKCIYIKQDGEEFDYTVCRTPKTELTEKEYGYCYCDVMGLYQSIMQDLEHDDITTIPLTSTGYVRRDCRNKMRKNWKNQKMFRDSAIDKTIYKLLKEEMRGGNTHCSRFFVGRRLKNMKNFDEASAYPYVMMCKYFPVSKFMRLGDVKDRARFKKFLELKCCLFRMTLENLQVKNEIPIPYISYSKAVYVSKETEVYNGRVLSSSIITLTVNEIDYEIITSQYNYTRMGISDMYIANRGELPKEMKSVIMEYFHNKCTLKGKDDYLYMKSKNLLNSLFGMCCTDPVREEWFLDEHKEWDCNKKEVAEELNRFYNSYNSFLPYQWGAWVTAHARKHLQNIIDTTGMLTVYVDTDSDKTQVVDVSVIEKMNEAIRKECEEHGAFVDYNGKRFYLGVYEREDDYLDFISLGAKKYAYIDTKGELHITIAGVKKDKGAKELLKRGGLDALGQAFIFKESAGLDLWYNDDKIHTITVDDCDILTASNIGSLAGTYTVHLTDDVLAFFDENVFTKSLQF